jgi:hypothetical protein
MSKASLTATQAFPSPIDSTVESFLPSLENRIASAGLALAAKSNGTDRDAYPVADFVGRCFLRVCFLVEICTSWNKKYNPPAFTVAVSKAQAAQIAAPLAAITAPVLQVTPTTSTQLDA